MITGAAHQTVKAARQRAARIAGRVTFTHEKPRKDHYKPRPAIRAGAWVR